MWKKQGKTHQEVYEQEEVLEGPAVDELLSRLHKSLDAVEELTRKLNRELALVKRFNARNARG